MHYALENAMKMDSFDADTQSTKRLKRCTNVSFEWTDLKPNSMMYSDSEKAPALQWAAIMRQVLLALTTYITISATFCL